MYKGTAFELKALDDGLVELVFDLQGESVNKFNVLSMNELSEVLDVLEKSDNIRGLLLSSGKDVFVVGADIGEFGQVFSAGEEAIKTHLNENNRSFNRFEDLPFPSVVAINGYALGGGTEICLAGDFRIASHSAKMGLPETKLGIIPGWGGTCRLPRLAGVDVAVDWICSGSEQKPDKALRDGVIDGLVSDEKLRESALRMLRDAAKGRLEYASRREQKKAPLRLNDMESILSFESSKAFVKAKAGRNYPAPVAAIQVMQNSAKFGRADALNFERDEFAKLAFSSVAQALVGLFTSDQALAKNAKSWQKKSSSKLNKAAVLGAGIMGGGIAYQSASNNVPVIMKDIVESGLQLGLKEASKLLNKLVSLGRMTPESMADVLTRIDTTLNYDGFDGVDIVVEAVVENADIKKSVLQSVEQHVKPDTILCSNTSTISISSLAEGLQRPENFCGMHFFNPVHRMPLVEVIRGNKSSDDAVARTVSYATALGKKAVVVNDCPGFLVNRVLFPYFAGFAMLLRDGADFQHVDRVMERWGWPMGPAYLLDVVGIDTGVHADNVMAQGFPDRMKRDFKSPLDILFEAKRYGQKTDLGFYSYEIDKKGKKQKVLVDDTYDLLKPHVSARREFSDDDIIARLMVPMVTELMRCIDSSIVSSVSEADIALIYGLGFPPFRGGVFRWLDAIGIENFASMARANAHLGKLYELTPEMEKRVQDKFVFYPTSR